MKISCPTCREAFRLEDALDDAAGRELVRLVAELEPPLARSVVTYLGLFRAPNRSLRWTRALDLCRETLALTADRRRLGSAIVYTLEALASKRFSGDWKPLRNHNYLKRVIETLGPEFSQRPEAGPGSSDHVAGWFREVVARHVTEMWSIGLRGRPSRHALELAVDQWALALWRSGFVEAVDRVRIEVAFNKLKATSQEWPAPPVLWSHLPARPEESPEAKVELTEKREALESLDEVKGLFGDIARRMVSKGGDHG